MSSAAAEPTAAETETAPGAPGLDRSGPDALPPGFPEDLEFYRRVVEFLPTPVVVLDESARLVYANRSGRRIGGWSDGELVGLNTVEHTHPDDQGWVAEVFLDDIVASDDTYRRLDGEPWAAVQFRMVAADGTVVPLEVTGNGGLDDPVVQGLVYDLRPAWTPVLLAEVLNGLARGRPADELLELVVETVAVPPGDIEATLVDVSDRGAHRVVAATGAMVAAALEGTADPAPWSAPTDEPTRVGVDALSVDAGAALLEAGHHELWHVAVDAEGPYRLVAVSPHPGTYDNALRQRLERARDLVAVVLLRVEKDRLLAEAALRDHLTGLANRHALEGRLEERLRAGSPVGLIYLDLDDFKEVNDLLGHAAGDDLLRGVADRLRAVTRAHDLVARLGGDELAVLVGGDADEALVREVATRVEAALDRPIPCGPAARPVPASLGAAIGVGVEPDELVHAADEAMYARKHGRVAGLEVAHIGRR